MKKLTLTLAVILYSFSTICLANANVNNIQSVLNDVYNKYKNYHKGSNASYIPALKNIDSNLFGIAVVTVDGKVWTVGDANKSFAIESISKPYAYALALQDNGETINDTIGLNATGNQFNSVIALEQQLQHRQNPFVNAGAIQVTSSIKGNNNIEKWERTLHFFELLSNDKVYVGSDYYHSESETNQHNVGIAYLLSSYGLLTGDPLDALDRYTKACSIVITAKQLAVMGSVLANNGIHPQTRQQIIEPAYVKMVLSQMAMNGLYENSGTWWTEVGIPAKSGVGGGILAVVPNVMAIVVYSPPLDNMGNSVKGQLVIKELSKKWNLHVFAH